jgi:hypothetical protein
MTTSQLASHLVGRSALLGALGFGSGFALAWALGLGLSQQIHDDNSGRLLGSILFACAGAVGGAALALGSESKRSLPLLALAGAVGCGLGYYITETIVSVWIDEHISGLLI